MLWLVPGLAFTKYRCEFVNLFCIYALMQFRVPIDWTICDIIRRIGLAIIVVPRDRTTLCTNARLKCAFNKQGRTTITIARTVNGRRLKGSSRRPVGDRAPPHDCAVQHTQIILGYNTSHVTTVARDAALFNCSLPTQHLPCPVHCHLSINTDACLNICAYGHESGGHFLESQCH